MADAARLREAGKQVTHTVFPGSNMRGLRAWTRFGTYLFVAAPVWNLVQVSVLMGQRTSRTTTAVGMVAFAVITAGIYVWFIESSYRLRASLHSHSASAGPAGGQAPEPGSPDRHDRQGTPWGYRFAVVAALAASATWVVLAFTVFADGADHFDNNLVGSPVGLVTTVVIWCVVSTLSITVPARRLLPLPVVAGVLASVAQHLWPGDSTAEPLLVGALHVASVAAILVMAAAELWFLSVAERLDSARETEARLAVAEERVRFSRDLHDVVGLALSAIAIKAEIGAEFARRGDERAADVMTEVRTLAQHSLKEARGVVAGYRAADLATELANARSLLASAGVTTVLTGDASTVPERLAEPFAWVVREGVTNVIRHSAAQRCVIAVTVSENEARLRIVNDGVTGSLRPRDDGGGSGLHGLRERLAVVGGMLTTAHDGEFVLEARAPA